VLRFWNHQVRTNSSGILQAVWDALFPANAVTLTPHPNPLPQGEGEGGKGETGTVDLVKKR